MNTLTTLADAIVAVHADVSANADEPMNHAQTCDHARSVLRLPESPYVAGGYPLEDDGTTLYYAYRMVLVATSAQIQVECALLDHTATWHDVAAVTLARWNAATVTPGGMHDERVDAIVTSAFNGIGDITGNDEFGVSVAWIDLADHLEFDAIVRDSRRFGGSIPADVDYSTLGAYLATAPGMDGERYALAYWYADGTRYAVGYPARAALADAFAVHADEFAVFERANDDTPHVGHRTRFTGAWYCDTCESPYCDLA